MIKTSETSQVEAQQYLQSIKKRGDALVEKWSKNSIGAKNEFGKGVGEIYSDNPSKARMMATMMENQEKHLKALKKFNENMISQNFQTTPENVLKIIKLGVANAIRGDLFTEVPLVTPDDALYYVERKISNTFTNRGTAGQIINENVNPYHPAEILPTSTVGSGATQYSITAGNPPIIPNKVRIYLDNRLVGEDDGAGAITPVVKTGSTNLTTSPTATYQTVNYTTGAVKLEFDAAVTAAEGIVVIASWDSEQSTNYDQYGKVKLTTRKQNFEARPQPLGYEYSQMTEVLLGTTMGLDTEGELIEAVGLEHALAKDYRAIRRANAIALSNQTYTFDADFANAGEVSANSHAQNIISKMDQISGDVFNDKKRGWMNKVVVGTNMATYLRKHKLWVEDSNYTKEGPCKIGKLAGYEVFMTPEIEDEFGNKAVSQNDAIMTYKNPREGLDIGLAIGVLTELSAKLTYPQMYTEGYIASVESMLELNKTFVRKLTLQNFTV
jgi:hypothetical protein